MKKEIQKNLFYKKKIFCQKSVHRYVEDIPKIQKQFQNFETVGQRRYFKIIQFIKLKPELTFDYFGIDALPMERDIKR